MTRLSSNLSLSSISFFSLSPSLSISLSNSLTLSCDLSPSWHSQGLVLLDKTASILKNSLNINFLHLSRPLATIPYDTFSFLCVGPRLLSATLLILVPQCTDKVYLLNYLRLGLIWVRLVVYFQRSQELHLHCNSSQTLRIC